MDNSPIATAKDLGILVLDEFVRLEAASFIEFICQSKKYIPNQYIRWRDPKTRQEEGFNVCYGQCDIVAIGQSVNLHLFDLPASLTPDFNLSDLIFPVEIDGCLLIANRHFGHMLWNRDKANSVQRSRNILFSWLAWIRTQKKPFLVATTGMESLVLTIEQLRDYLDLDPQIPIWEIPSQFTVGQKYVSNLDAMKRALTTLVEDILLNTA